MVGTGRKETGLHVMVYFSIMQRIHPRPVLHFAASLPLLIASLASSAQETTPPEHFIHNTTVFAEAWGEGVFNSLNIEKTMTTPSLVSYHFRLGFGYWKPGANFYALPVDVALSYGRVMKVELSIGATPYAFSTKDAMVSGALAPTFGLHLRFQDPNGGVFLRAGALIAPMTSLNDIPGNEDYREKGTWGWNPGLGLGVTF